MLSYARSSSASAGLAPCFQLCDPRHDQLAMRLPCGERLPKEVQQAFGAGAVLALLAQPVRERNLIADPVLSGRDVTIRGAPRAPGAAGTRSQPPPGSGSGGSKARSTACRRVSA